MSSISFFSLLFFALPAPLKIVLIMVGGLSLVKVRQEAAHMHHAQAARAEHVEHAAPRAVREPVRELRAVPVRPAENAAPLVITVNSDGSFAMVGAKLSEEQFVNRLKAMAAADPQRKIELKADALTPHQMVANAVKISKAAGLRHVSFAAKPEAP